MPSDSFVQNLKTELNQKLKIIILTHYNPDGDAIGSSLALKHYLDLKGKHSTVIVPNEFPKFLKWLPGVKDILVAEYKMETAKQLILNADLIFCLDFNTSSRINHLEPFLTQSKAIKVLIDHHQQPDEYDLVYSDTNIPATCQMIYQLIDKLNDKELINKQIAECIYTGIYTDTGGFRFRSTTSKTHLIAADLLDKGIKSDEIISNILDNNTLSRFMLLAQMLQKVEVLEEYRTAILYITKEDMLKYGYKKGDTDGFVNYGLSIAGIDMVVFFTDDLKQDYVKISFRSKEKVDVNEFSRKHFNGGGHKQAAGGKSEISIPESIEKLKQILKNETI